ncbi:cell division protein FtsX [Pseudahrensia aquimaris]|uniref:Cell division protein FtsX n=1 Tax=Pseudahrensia aquimaris TaxID=744461 RepID=A0ABW3FF00_9HYPH
MTDSAVTPETEEEANKPHSIVPRANVAGTALMLVIAIMAFLGSLTLGAVTLVNDTARGWQSEIAREVTIQLRPIDGQDMNDALARAQEVVGGFTGVTRVDIVDDATAARLLEPWLGEGLDLKELPVPRLISVGIDENNPPDFDTMRSSLAESVNGATLDNHRAWVDRLTTMARATIVSGLTIFALMMAATILTVIFATRGAMAGNAHVIEVLHFVGAEPGYIANQFQRHFLLLGLKGALAGGAVAIICFLAIGLWTRRNVADPSADQVAALFGTFSVGPWGYVGTIVLIFAIGMLTAITSRATVLRHVGDLDASPKR